MANYPGGDPAPRCDQDLDSAIIALPAGAATPPLGLLLDVDGPISSPISRTVAVPGLARDLTALANAGIPIAFNTGRSAEFLLAEVAPVLAAAGLDPAAPVWGIGEKGGIWFSFARPEELIIDRELALSQSLQADLRGLVENEFSELAFFDRTKHTMVSFEQHTHITNDRFQAERGRMDHAVATLLARHGLSYVWEGRPELAGGPAGAAVIRIDPTIIATDIEHVGTGKDTGAHRFLTLLAESGTPVPRVWRTMGDSRTDYAMATWLNEQGFSVAHVDVRPSDGIPAVPFAVLTHRDLIHDHAGAAFIAEWAKKLRSLA